MISDACAHLDCLLLVAEAVLVPLANDLAIPASLVLGQMPDHHVLLVCLEVGAGVGHHGLSNIVLELVAEALPDLFELVSSR